MPSQEQREAILQAAEQLFSRFGLKKTSMDEIARRAGVAKPIIYRHFVNKDEIIGEYVRRRLLYRQREFYGICQTIDGYGNKLLAIFDAMLEAAKDIDANDEVALELLLETGRRLEAHRDFDQLATIIAEGIEAGEFREFPVDQVTRGIDSALRGVGIESALTGRDVHQVLDDVKTILEIIVRGLQKKTIPFR